MASICQQNTWLYAQVELLQPVDLLDSFVEVADIAAALGSHVASLPDVDVGPSPSASARRRGQQLLLAYLEEQTDGTRKAVDRARDKLQVR